MAGQEVYFGGELTWDVGRCFQWHSLQRAAATAVPVLGGPWGFSSLKGEELYMGVVSPPERSTPRSLGL